MTIVQALEENALAYYQGITRLLGGQWVEDEQVTWFTTGHRSLFRFNGVLHTAIPQDQKLDKVLDPLLAMFQSKDLPFFWVDWEIVGTPGLGDYLRSKNVPWIHINGMPTMSRGLDDLPASTLPKEVDIIRVQSQQEQADWLDVFMEGFQEPEAARQDFQEFLVKSMTEPQAVFEHYLAYWQGKPCAVSTLLHSRTCAGIYHVTTLPSFRGRGLGNALTLSPMHAARNAGYSEIVLFATSSGFPVYQRLGFSTVSTADLFALNEKRDGTSALNA